MVQKEKGKMEFLIFSSAYKSVTGRGGQAPDFQM